MDEKKKSYKIVFDELVSMQGKYGVAASLFTNASS